MLSRMHLKGRMLTLIAPRVTAKSQTQHLSQWSRGTTREAFDQEMLRHTDDPNVSFSEAVYLANIEMCRRYGLAFYKGKGGSLREVYRP